MSSILQDVARGDVLALRESVQRHGATVWSMARRLLGDGTGAEDAVAEAMVAVWQAAGRFDPSLTSEASFVRLVARRRILELRRGAARGRDADDSTAPAGSLDPGLGDGDLDGEARAAAAALADLDLERRAVLAMAICQGMSPGEIAPTLDLEVETVRSHVRTGLAHVRQALLAAPLDARQG